MDSTTETSSDESCKPVHEKGTYKCTYEGCTATFAKNSKLLYHIRRHTGERPFACDVPDCNKTYLYSFHLRRHKDLQHCNRAVERIICTVEGCHMELANKYSLRKHLKRKHNPERSYPFNCDECRQGFHRKRQLLQHSYVHTGIFPFKCEICQSGFPSTRDCNRHKRTHTTYLCKCGNPFERWSQLLAHKKLCETVRPKCTICDKTFSQRTNLKKHLEVHVTENVSSYTCGYDNCSRSYLHKKNLLYHINKYHEKISLPRIACPQANCKKRFSKRQNLQHHIKIFHSANSQQVRNVKRKPRKDKGVPHTSTAAALAGLKLPLEVNRAIIQGVPVELSKAIIPTVPKKNENNRKENRKTSQQHIMILKDKLKEALLNNIGCSTKPNCDTDDNENKKTFVELLC